VFRWCKTCTGAVGMEDRLIALRHDVDFLFDGAGHVRGPGGGGGLAGMRVTPRCNFHHNRLEVEHF